MSIHDKQMPIGWHTIKCVLLTEIKTAENFALCCEAADALFHARLIGESIAREMGVHGVPEAGQTRSPQDESANTEPAP